MDRICIQKERRQPVAGGFEMDTGKQMERGSPKTTWRKNVEIQILGAYWGGRHGLKRNWWPKIE